MELIIKENWTQKIRNEKVKEYISELSKLLFEQCLLSSKLTKEEKGLLTLQDCQEYLHTIVNSYIQNMTCGCFEMLITERTVSEVLLYTQAKTIIQCNF